MTIRSIVSKYSDGTFNSRSISSLYTGTPVPYVTDGLVLFLDASNPDSYPGSGSTWFDISGNERHYSIGSSISWNSAGYFAVSGGTFTGPASNSFGFTSDNEHYIEVVSKINGSPTSNNFFNWQATPNTGTNTRAIQTHFYYANGYSYYDVSGCCVSTQRIQYVNDSSLATSINHFAWRTRKDTTPNREMIKNRVSQVNSGTNNTATVTWNITNAATIGNLWNGNLYSFRVYNRALTDEEAQQNYLWDKERFGF